MTLFLRLLDNADKEAALRDTVARLRDGEHDAFEVAPADFRQVPGSPFAYWASESIWKVFRNVAPFENEDRHATKGLATTDDFRFARLWWEVQSEQSTPRKWVLFSKGGSFAKYYSDIHLLVDWAENGQEIKDFLDEKIGRSGQWSRWINAVDYYFRPGLTWPRRTQAGLSIRILPANCIFSDKGPSIFIRESKTFDLLKLLSLTNSSTFSNLVAYQMAFGSYEVGVIQRTPVPNLDNADGMRLGELALACVEIKRNLDQANETSHVFHLPALLQVAGVSLAARAEAWTRREREAAAQLERNQNEIDEIAFQLYGISEADRAAIRSNSGLPTLDEEAEASDETDEAEEQATADSKQLARDLLSYAMGCAFGRWDVRHATGEQATPELPDPFAPLPAYSPGMLRNHADALPALRPNADGILADDEGVPSDIVRRVRDVFDLIWGDGAEAIEREWCEIMGVRSLRDYLRRSGKGGFWQDHIGRYSKSRRKAPIYWLLQSPKGRYALWLYYPAYNADTLAKALQSYVEPKLRRELERLASLRAAVQTIDPSARRKLEREAEQQEDLLNDIQEFRDRLERAARRSLRPDHNDGVLLNIAPLWELTPWAEAKRAWSELQIGKYEWATVSKQLRGEFEQNIPEFQTEWEAVELDTLPKQQEDTSTEAGSNSNMTPRRTRPILSRLRLNRIGPAAALDFALDRRINIFTGDNGLGKTFVLDAAWRALTGQEPPVPIRPLSSSDPSLLPEISYAITSPSNQLLGDEVSLIFQPQQDAWVVNSGAKVPELKIAPRPGLVIYVRVDGISVWSEYNQHIWQNAGLTAALNISNDLLWSGLQGDYRKYFPGVIDDLREWQRAQAELKFYELDDKVNKDEAELEGLRRRARLLDLLNRLLEKLSPGTNEPLKIAGTRVLRGQRTAYPAVSMTYDSIPINHSSAAVKRIIAIAYVLVSFWDDHVREARERNEEPTTQITMLIDEVELHLHPKWQRLIVPALEQSIRLLDDQIHVQYLVTTHAPLVLASLEPFFEEERDQLFDFDLEDGEVVVYKLPWAKHGETSNWLTSAVFDLQEARSLEGEQAIKAAEALMLGEDPSTVDEKFVNLEAVQSELIKTIPEGDPFWERWRPYISS